MQRLSILIFSSLLLASISVQADKGMAMKHANPMPNLMKVAMMYGDELNLNAEQKTAMLEWSSKAGPTMGALVKGVISAEKGLHSAALSNASQSELQDLMDKVLSLRLQVAKGKIRCRENMRKVLDEQQWSKMVRLYQQKIM